MRKVLLCGVGVAIGMVASLAGCKRAPNGEGVAPPDSGKTPAPPDSVWRAMHVPGDSAHLASIPRGGVIAYARSLEYADTTTTQRPPGRYHGEWDLNLLDTLGTFGLVQPEVNIHRSSPMAAGWDSGRVQLEITILPSANHPGTVVDLYGTRLFPGTTYVWVDSLSLSGDSGTARALYIPVDDTLPIQRRLLHVLGTGPPPWNHAVARWTPVLRRNRTGGAYDPLGTCWSCVQFGWCH